MGKLKKTIENIYLSLIVLFLYAPIFTLIVLSFNEGKSRAKWQGFTTSWYQEMWADEAIMAALRNTLVIALISALIATVIGTMAAIAINNMKPLSRNIIMGITNIPMLNADIVTGISMMLCFIAFRISLGFKTILISHITFNIPYVILSVMPKLTQMDPDLEEAALDLGCTPVKAFFRVVIHEIMPGIISGALMAFTMSLDDFVISYFVYGPNFVTLPVEIYNYTKKPLQPKIYALFTLLFLVILLLMVLMNLLQLRDARQRQIRKGGAS